MDSVTKDLLEALKSYVSFGCPVCGGDCYSANPPQTFCLMKQACDAIARAEAALAKPQPDADGLWKSAVIDQLVISHILTAEHESNPRKALQDLLAFESDIAVDPRVSEAAAKLVEQARAEEREAWPDLTCVIQWLEAGCDPKDAAKELRLIQGKILAKEPK